MFDLGLIGVRKNHEKVLVELRGSEVSVEVRGFVAHVSVKLTYFNQTEEPLEVTYYCPVDEKSAVYSFEAEVGATKIIAKCIEKQKAKEIYDKAIEAGQTAILAGESEHTSDLLILRIGNLPSNKEAVLKVDMVKELPTKTDGALHFVLPTVFNPRYAPAGYSLKQDVHSSCHARHECHRLQMAAVNPLGTRDFVNFEIPDCTSVMMKTYSMEVEAKVWVKENPKIISHTDAIDVKYEEDCALIKQNGGYSSDHDWSFLVYYATMYKPIVLRERGDPTSSRLMKDDILMINLFPGIPDEGYSAANEIIFITDCSGSMQGDKIQSAKATLLLFLKSLPIGCRFNVVLFGSSHTFLFPEGSKEYSEANLEKALSLQQTMDANMGGTEILQPFRAVYESPLIPGFARQVLLITDGEVWNVSDVTELVAGHVHESRVFAIGVGHGASSALVSGVARAGGGRSEMVVQQDMLQVKVMGMVASMLQENVNSVHLECDLDPQTRIVTVPKTPSVIFGGQHLILYARVPKETEVKSLCVTGRVADKPVEFKYAGDIGIVHDTRKPLHRLAARAQIQQWQIDNEENIKEETIELSRLAGVASKYTAFVGVDQDGQSLLPVCQEKTEEGPVLMAGLMSSVRMRCCDSMNYKSEMAMSSLSMQKQKKRSAGLSLPSINLQAAVNPIKGFFFGSTKAPGGDKTNALTQEKVAEECCDRKEKIMPPVAPSSSDEIQTRDGDQLLEILKLQKFDGSWDSKSILDFCSKKILSGKPSNQEDTIWATAVVLAILEVRFQYRKVEWKLIATKAEKFLAGKKCDVANIVAEVKKLL